MQQVQAHANREDIADERDDLQVEADHLMIFVIVKVATQLLLPTFI